METIYNGNSKKAGVYRIKNKINNRVYIGSTKKFSVRFAQHLKSLLSGSHHNKFLQADFNKCGIDNFIFEVIEVVNENQTARLVIEQKYIDKQFDNGQQCYNFRAIVNSNPKGKNKQPRLPLSQEVKDKIGKASSAAWANTTVEQKQELAAKRKEMTTLRWQEPEYRAKTLAGFARGAHKVSAAQKAKAATPEGKEELLRRLAKANEKRPPKTVTLISPDGEVVTITNLYKWCRDNGYNYEGMRWITRGKNHSHKGWRLFIH